MSYEVASLWGRAKALWARFALSYEHEEKAPLTHPASAAALDYRKLRHSFCTLLSTLRFKYRPSPKGTWFDSASAGSAYQLTNLCQAHISYLITPSPQSL